MKRYIEQLIEDLEEAKNLSQAKLNLFFNNYEGEDYDIYVDDEDGGIAISDLIGIDQIYFPSADYMDDYEIIIVVNKIVEVYNQYGMNPLFNERVSSKIMYEHLRLHMNCKVYPVEGEIVDIELCDYLPHNCPLFEMCYTQNLTCHNSLESEIYSTGTNFNEIELTQ